MIKSLLLESLLNEKTTSPRKALLISTVKKMKPDGSILKQIDGKLGSMFPSQYISIRSDDDSWVDVTVTMKDFTLSDAIANVKPIKAAMDELLGVDTLVSILQ